MIIERSEWDGTRGSAKMHKLRKITKSTTKNDTFGITLPREKVMQYEGAWFSTRLVEGHKVLEFSGTYIILQSGAKP